MEVDGNVFGMLRELGVGAVLVVILLKLFYTEFGGKMKRQEVLLRDINIQVRELHEWHDHRDTDGVFTWYVRQSLENKLDSLAGSISDLTKAIQAQNAMWQTMMAQRPPNG